MKYADGLKPGMLLRIKKQCRESRTIREHGEYALLVHKLTKAKSGISWDALFPSGQRIVFMPMNWEVINGPE